MKTCQRLFAIIFSGILISLLTACASTVSSQVSRFHDWSAQYNHATFLIEKPQNKRMILSLHNTPGF